MKRIAAAGAAALLIVGGVLFTPAGGDTAAAPTSACLAPGGGTLAPTGPAQKRNVETIIARGKAAGVSPVGIQIAIAVTLVEAGGLNLASRAVPESMRYPNDGVVTGDLDSINLFQQRVSMGWFDTVAHGMDVTVATDSFYRALKVIPYDRMGFGAAAQAVQHSAFPGRYGARQVEAVALYNQLAAGAVSVPSTVCQPAPAGGVTISGHWANPLKPASYTVGSPFGPRIDPVLGIPKLHKGQDLMVPTGTPVHAVCDGVVALAGWDLWGGGNMTTLDCGGGITVKLMHQSRLLAATGTPVKAGQVTGLSGSTGNSTGPHLHEQVEQDGVPVNPIPFMAARGVPL